MILPGFPYAASSKNMTWMTWAGIKSEEMRMQSAYYHDVDLWVKVLYAM